MERTRDNLREPGRSGWLEIVTGQFAIRLSGFPQISDGDSIMMIGF
jgi:hypothetical protein